MQAVLKTLLADALLADSLTPFSYRTGGRPWASWLLALENAERLRAGSDVMVYTDAELQDTHDVVYAVSCLQLVSVLGFGLLEGCEPAKD